MIAVHERPGSYSDRWIEYCRLKGIPFKPVDCLSSDAIEQCSEADAVMWHWWIDGSVADRLVARQIIISLETGGKIVFPNFATCWHYDDKVGQKYLLEAIRAPLIPTQVFFERTEAVRWLEETSFPKVHKLRCGAGSNHVRLVRSAAEGRSICKRAFTKGFPVSAGYFVDSQTKLSMIRNLPHLIEKAKRMPRVMWRVLLDRRRLGREPGYVYFQDFLSGNLFDTRVTIVGNRAFAFRRWNRPGDFRASGSGRLDHDVDAIDMRCVQTAFRVADSLGTQSLAFDFLSDASGNPSIAEISYCYLATAVHDCTGHWDRDLNWHPGHVWPEEAMIEDVLSAIAAP